MRWRSLSQFTRAVIVVIVSYVAVTLFAAGIYRLAGFHANFWECLDFSVDTIALRGRISGREPLPNGGDMYQLTHFVRIVAGVESIVPVFLLGVYLPAVAFLATPRRNPRLSQ